MPRVVDTISRSLAVAGAVITAATMIAICADVLRRYTTGRGVAGVYEYSEIALVAIVYLGMADAQRRGEHVSVSFLVSRLPPRARRAVQLLVLGLVCAFLGAMVVFTAQEAARSYARQEVRFGLVRVPIWPARWLITIGLAGFALQVLESFRKTLRGAPPQPPGDASTPRGP